jgi:hypothetical protein
MIGACAENVYRDTFFLIPFYLQAVQIHLANVVKCEITTGMKRSAQ